MNTRRILLSLASIVFVGSLVAGGTGAFFSDTETSEGNRFTAGALDLKVDSVAHYNGLVCFAGTWHPESTVEWDGEKLVLTEENVQDAIDAYNDPALNPMLNPFVLAGSACGGTWDLTDLGPELKFFDYSDLKPGDSGENTISLHVYDNDAYMCAAIHNVKSNENGCTSPEVAVDGTCGTPGMGEGELDQELNFLIWEDDGDNMLQQGEDILYQGLAAAGVAGVYPLYTPDTGVFTGGTTGYLGVYWCYGNLTVDGTDITCDGAPVTNLTQTDSLEADITFYVEQARHNENFECPPLADFEGPGTPIETELVVTEGDGWSPEALSGVLNQNRWVAKARYGANNPTGSYELEVGYGPGFRDEGNHVYASGVGESFSLAYDDTTKIATVTVGNDSATYDLSGGTAGTPTSIGITAKGGSGDSTSLTGIFFNGNAVPDLVSPTTGPVHHSLSGSEIEGNFLLTGTLTLNWVSPQDELPALQIDVLY